MTEISANMVVVGDGLLYDDQIWDVQEVTPVDLGSGPEGVRFRTRVRGGTETKSFTYGDLNKDIQPGTYQTTALQVSSCYWERGTVGGDIIDNDFVSAAVTVTVRIRSTDALFTSQRCGAWNRIGD